MKHHLLLLFHLIAATIWIGGHLTLALTVLPKALKQKRPELITNFEKSFSIGMPALIILVITGVWMAYDFAVPVSSWFSFNSPIEKVVSTKLLLLMLSLLFALSAKFRLLKNLTQQKLPEMAFHIIMVTLIGIGMLVLGSTVRYGGI